jgi:hypothetical protein
MIRRFAPCLVLVAVAATGCARVTSSLDDNVGGNGATPDLATSSGIPDFGGPSTDPADLATAGVHDLATPSSSSDMAVARDLATPPDLATPRDLATPPDLATPSNCHVVINEVQTGTSASGTEEFAEIYNPCASDVSVAGWKLGYRAATNTDAVGVSDDSTLYTFAGSLTAGSYFVLGGVNFKGTKQGSLATGLAASGSVALRGAAGTVVDSVAWGTITAGNAFVEGTAAPTPPTLASPGGSIERMPNGTDTDHNNSDFSTTSTATPGAANH